MSENPRYGTNSNNTSEWMNALKNEYQKMPRGAFNNTRRKSFDVPLYGIVPVECWEMVPNSEAYLQYDISAIAKNPTVKKLLSGMNIELRVYKIDYNDCFEGWNNFITKGRSGKVVKSIPYVDFSLGTSTHTTSLPYNPCHYLNIAPSVFLAQDTNGDKYKFTPNTGIKSVSGDSLQSTTLTGLSTVSGLKSSVAMRVSALPFVFYNKIAKNFQTANLLQDNPNWYPENENHDNILPYSASGGVTTSSFDYPTQVLDPSKPVQPDNTSDTFPWLNVLWYAQRKGDMFNTGSPFPDLLRGDIPTLDVLTAKLNPSAAIATSRTGTSAYILGLANGYLGLLDSTGAASSNIVKNGTGSPTSWFSNTSTPPSAIGVTDSSADDLKNTLSKITVDGINYSLRQWRYLATLTVMRERLALTDGSYNEMIEAMFGHNPRWHNHEAQYVGGHSQPIVFSEVVNQTESVNAPLGSMAGRAYSDTASQTIHVTSDDFGMFMTVMVVTPDEYYSQGVDKMFSRLENAEQYFPILNNLSADATLNRELYVSGTNNTDMDVFNYQERFAYYKSRRNQVSGLLSLPASLIGDDGVYIQNRLFGSTPQFNQAFARGELTANEKAIFSVTDMAPFVVTVGCGMRYIGPIPENAKPSDMGISY